MPYSKFWKCLTVCFLQHFLCACAGPTSPFGAIHDFTPTVKATKLDLSLSSQKSENKNITLSFYPKHQFYHKENNLKIDLKGKYSVPDIKNLRLIYNHTDLTELFVKNSTHRVYPNENLVRIEFKDLKLSAKQVHQISFIYLDNIDLYSYNFGKPSCGINKKLPAKGLHGFSTPSEFLSLINTTGRVERINASLIAGLVAMESAFNPLAVSTSKAIGLTQITDIADTQINKKTEGWPRRDLSSLPYSEVKEKITNGEISQDEDWRLEPSLSLKGGASYLKYIISYWNLKEQKELLAKHQITTEDQITDVVLASYNSGPERIKNHILKNNKKWLDDPELKNVRYYIKMIYSYCNDFAEDPKI